MNRKKKDEVSPTTSDDAGDLIEVVDTLLDKEILGELQEKDPALADKVRNKIIKPDALLAVCHKFEHIENRYSGPVPPPDMIREYEGVIPGLGDRLINMAEKEQSHRHAMDKSVLSSTSNEKQRGQLFGFLIGITALTVSLIAALNGANAVGGIVGGTTVVGLVTVFVVGKRLQRKADGEDAKDTE